MTIREHAGHARSAAGLGRTILVLDDQIGETGSLQQKGFLARFERLPYTFVFETCREGERYSADVALKAVERETDASLVLLDLKFGAEEDLLGFDVLRRISARYPSLPVLIMSSLARDIEKLGRCLEGGAVGFVEKSRNAEQIRATIEQAVEMMHSHVLLGQSMPLRELRRQAARLSPYDQIPVLIVGERGTGKERVARYVHHNGPRHSGPFVAVNCTGVPESLFEGEFFGAEKGAYTGAAVLRAGYLERAHGGTLFLDEVGTMPLRMQAKLLRALQERSFSRLGSAGEEIKSSFQLLSATNVAPWELVSSGRLREDFYDRIAAVTVRTPPLRECMEDLPLLATHFLRRLVGERKALHHESLAVLARHSWPGNVRELQRVVQEAIVRSEDSPDILPVHLPERLLRGPIEGGGAGMPPSGRKPSDAGKNWSRQRLLTELQIAVEAKRAIETYRGKHWKAELMRRVYPHCKAQNAKGLADLIRRLTKGPWGDPAAREDPDIARLLRELET